MPSSHSQPPVSDIAFTPTVKSVQERLGSRKSYAGMEQRGGWSDEITADLTHFISLRESLYLGTATTTGRPYIQHRGGPAGFLKVLDAKTLALADYMGNRQYISMGNLEDNDQAFIFLMDYRNQQRIKIWGRAEFVEDDPELLARVTDKDYAAKPQRVLLFHLQAWDSNCPKHIPPLLSPQEVEEREQQLQARIRDLEAENAKLRGG